MLTKPVLNFQKGAKLAMNLLPTKRGIVLKVVPSGDQLEIEKAYQDFHRYVPNKI
jgi:hypothetical protein